jgi:subtilisin family serine protease
MFWETGPTKNGRIELGGSHMSRMAAARSSLLGRSTLVAFVLAILVNWAVAVTPAAAEQRLIVRATSLLRLNLACLLVGCKVRYGLDGGLGHVFLVTTGDGVNLQTVISLLLRQLGILNAEIDHVVKTEGATAGEAPPALFDREPVYYHGATVWRGYVAQPAAQLVRVGETQDGFGLTGWGVTVAVIDTGIDPDHPVLRHVITSGYDFTREDFGGSEMADVPQASTINQGESGPARISQSTMVILDQSTMVILDNSSLEAFGHGTIVSGLIHLVAPNAQIMPLKAFKANGTGYASDILRAIYHAVHNGAKVINMSFSYPQPSLELKEAIGYAASNGLVSIASAGNSGQRVATFPATLSNVVGVASSSDADVLSSFSNFGSDLFWIAAPGEGVVSTFPFGTYAAAWGTSFSAPFAAGAAALLAEMTHWISQGETSTAVGQAVPVEGVARGRLDIVRAVQSRTAPVPW